MTARLSGEPSTPSPTTASRTRPSGPGAAVADERVGRGTPDTLLAVLVTADEVVPGVVPPGSSTNARAVSVPVPLVSRSLRSVIRYVPVPGSGSWSASRYPPFQEKATRSTGTAPAGVTVTAAVTCLLPVRMAPSSAGSRQTLTV